MARLHFVKKARNDIYSIGLPEIRIHAKGKNVGQEYTFFDKANPNLEGEDELIIAKGESYYWWQFAFRLKTISKERPSRSRLTNSAFLSEIYDIEDNFRFDVNDFESSIEDLKSQLEELQNECQNSLYNMPESLQDCSPAGELLNERIENLQYWMDDLENIDTEIDETELRQQAQNNQTHNPDKEDAKVEISDVAEEVFESLKEERKQDIIQQLEDCNPGF